MRKISKTKVRATNNSEGLSKTIKTIDRLEVLENKNKQSRISTKESDDFISVPFGNITDLITVQDVEYNVIRTNKKINEVFGNNLVGKKCYKAYHDRDDVCEDCPAGEVMRTGGPFFSAEQQDKFGNVVEIWTVPIKNDNGDIIAIIEHGRDITDHKQAEATLKESEQKFRSLFENMLDGYAYCMMLFDENSQPVDFVYLEINKAFERITGLRREDIIDNKVTEAIPGTKEAHPELFNIYGKVALTGEATQFETFFYPLGIWLNISVYSPRKGYFVAVFENITERKMAEVVIRESEVMFRSLVNNVRLGILRSTPEPNGRFIEVNPAMTEIFGYSRKELLDMNATDLYIHPEERVALPNELDTKKNRITKEILLRKKDGTEVIILETKVPVWDDDGKIIYFDSILEDITERKQARSALVVEKERAERYLDVAMVLLVMIDTDEKIAMINKKGCEILGYAEEELIGKNWFDTVVPLQLREERRNTFHETLAGKDDLPNREISLITKDGDEILVASNNVTILDSTGKLNGRLLSGQDITEQKQAEEALRISEQNFHNSLDNSPYPIMVFMVYRKRGKIVYANQKMLDLFGYKSIKEMQNMPMAQRFTPKYLLIIQERFNKVERGEFTPEHLEHEIICTNGEIRIVEVFIDKILWDEENANQVTYYDITERKRAEEELRKSHEDLSNLSAHLRTVREEERRLMARVFHDDLGQLLTALKMDLSWLSKRLPQNMKTLLGKTAAMSKLIDTTIQTVKRLSTQLRPAILDDLGLVAAIEWQVAEFQERTGIKCEFYLGTGDIIVGQERTISIFRIFQEGLTNIARHTVATVVKISLRVETTRLMLEIRDNGKGITTEQISSPKSFGLLGIKERAKYWGGNVEIRGIRGEGTTIFVSIPLDPKG